MDKPDYSWIDWPETKAVVAALGAENMRFVGGAVRDSLLGAAVADIDIATSLLPGEVISRAVAAGLKAVPTGIDHGTVTLVAQHRPFEVTTLRRDVSTDGRRATVAFTDDWQQDAARRDFTINALYLDSARQLYDYFGGAADVKEGRVRFIGDADQRIQEDALRILRFFRFCARYAILPLDSHGLAACTRRARDMMALSRERIREELLKLLAAPNPLPVLEVMLAHKLFDAFLPEVTSLDVLQKLVPLEVSYAVADPLRRLAALLPPDSESVSDIAARFKCSKSQRSRLVAASRRIAAVDARAMRAEIYWHGAVTAMDRLLLCSSSDIDIAPLFDIARQWHAPELPVSGKHLIAAGLPAGPAVSEALTWLEQTWAAGDFDSDRRTLDQLVKAAVDRSQQSL
jgi:poly(A) polymerase